MASRLFDLPTRERAWLLYAWCRKCDDIADGQDHGGTMQGVTDGQARLSAMRLSTDAALRGEPTGDPAFDGFGLVMRECGIPVVMISRPIKPDVPAAHTPEAVMALTETLLRT